MNPFHGKVENVAWTLAVGARALERGDEEATAYRVSATGSMVRGYAYDMEQFLMVRVDVYCQRAALKKDQLKEAATPFLDESKEQPCNVDKERGRDRDWAQFKKPKLPGHVLIAASSATAAVPDLPPRLRLEGKVSGGRSAKKSDSKERKTQPSEELPPSPPPTEL